jgi:hypothetical protein
LTRRHGLDWTPRDSFLVVVAVFVAEPAWVSVAVRQGEGATAHPQRTWSSGRT